MQSEFGERLRYFRIKKGITIEKLADNTGISASVLRLIEKGEKKRLSYYLIQTIADALGIDIEDLVEINKVE